MQRGGNDKEEPDGITTDDAVNPFDPKRLRIAQRFGEGLDVRVVLASVAVRKPHRQWFVRVHPDPAMRLNTFLLHRESEQQYYLVDPALAPSLPGETVATSLFTAVNLSGAVFLWPIRLPDENGQQHECHVTALRAAEIAQNAWVRISWDRAQSNYAVIRARGQVADAGATEFEGMAASMHKTPQALRLYVKRSEAQRITAARKRRLLVEGRGR